MGVVPSFATREWRTSTEWCTSTYLSFIASAVEYYQFNIILLKLEGLFYAARIMAHVYRKLHNQIDPFIISIYLSYIVLNHHK